MSKGFSDDQIDDLISKKILYEAFYIIQDQYKYSKGKYLQLDGEVTTSKLLLTGLDNEEWLIEFSCGAVLLKKKTGTYTSDLIEEVFNEDRTCRKKKVLKSGLQIYRIGYRPR